VEKTDTLSVVRAYHQGWTGKNFETSEKLLASELRVEVPINEYPDRESFGKALEGFGSMTRGVKLLAEFADGDEAMLLYDMEVEHLGMLRVAEHFTVCEGKITRIRQIHDTAALRSSGFAGSASSES